MRSDSDGRDEVYVWLESSLTPQGSLSVSTGDWDSEASLKLYSACTDSRRPTLGSEGLRFRASVDGLRSRRISTPESACSRSLEGEGLITALDRVLVVGSGILETGRGIPLGGLRDLVWSIIITIATGLDDSGTVA